MSSAETSTPTVWEDRPDCNCGRRTRKYVQRKCGPNQGKEMYLCHERNEWLNYQREAMQLEEALSVLEPSVRPVNSWVQRANARWGSGTLEKDPKALRPENKAPGCDFFMYRKQWDAIKNTDRFRAIRQALNESTGQYSSTSRSGPSAPQPSSVLKTVQGTSKSPEFRPKPYDRPRVRFDSSCGSSQSAKGKEPMYQPKQHISSSLEVEPSSSGSGSVRQEEIIPVDYMPIEEEEYRLVTGLMNPKGSKDHKSSDIEPTNVASSRASGSGSSRVKPAPQPAVLQVSPALANQVSTQLTQAVENWRKWFEQVLMEVGEELEARLASMQPTVNQQLREALDPRNFSSKKDA